MVTRTLVLGAGFGGLELAAVLSEEFGDDAGVTLIDEREAFVFGYSKLDVLFGRATPTRSGCVTTSASRASASSRRRSPRSTPRRGG